MNKRTFLQSISLAFWLIAIVCFASSAGAVAPKIDFSLHKLTSRHSGNRLLIIGGIQGDEPGGFNAASLIATRYRVSRGEVWVIPNLNFLSIIKRSRGVYGDLNRKFARISESDPEFDIIQKVKQIILDEDVDIVLNLHDGSGFYREQYIDALHSPRRWGQCVIIDQEKMDSPHYGDLAAIADYVVKQVNQHLYEPEHEYHVNNTHTGQGNVEMSKTLTWFSVLNGKPAFGVEASKSFNTPKRAYYHLRVIEAFMAYMGIAYERGFALSQKGVETAIEENINLAFYNRRIFLDAENVRSHLRYFPLQKGTRVEFTTNNPLITVVNNGSHYRVFYGNRHLTRLMPQYFEYDSGLDAVTMEIDGHRQQVNFGEMVDVAEWFLVEPTAGYRTNVIGFKREGITNESGISIGRKDIRSSFSIDRNGGKFRVEVYREKKFAGMVLVNFDSKSDLLKTASTGKAVEAQPPGRQMGR